MSTKPCGYYQCEPHVDPAPPAKPVLDRDSDEYRALVIAHYRAMAF